MVSGVDIFDEFREGFIKGFVTPGVTREDAEQVFTETTVRKISAVVPMSTEMAMDYGIISDTRPPSPPLSRWVRFRSWRRGKIYAWRLLLASRLAGFDVTDY